MGNHHVRNESDRRTAPAQGTVPAVSYLRAIGLRTLALVRWGETLASGVFAFDAQGNLWSGQNWSPGSQSGVARNIGGGAVKFSPNGTALSPPITAFTGMGLDGVPAGAPAASGVSSPSSQRVVRRKKSMMRTGPAWRLVAQPRAEQVGRRLSARQGQ
jgi:hypothetical protein